MKLMDQAGFNVTKLAQNILPESQSESLENSTK